MKDFQLITYQSKDGDCWIHGRTNRQ